MAKSDTNKPFKSAVKKVIKAKKALEKAGDKPDEKIPNIPQNEKIKPTLKGKKLFKFWVNFVRTLQRMFKAMSCGNAQCIRIPRSKKGAPNCFHSLQRNDCRCVYEAQWGYFWKHYDVNQYNDPTDYLSYLMSKIHGNTSCSICFDELGKDNLNKCTNKKCKYFFHSSCLREWWGKNNSCPCCRSPIS